MGAADAPGEVTAVGGHRRDEDMSPGHSLIVAACAHGGDLCGRYGAATRMAFRCDGVLGTSAELLVASRGPAAARHVQMAVFGEIERLTAILSTRDPASEISTMIGRRCSRRN